MKEIIDQFGQPLRKDNLKKEVITPKVSGVNNHFNVTTSLNPRKLARILNSATQGNASSYLALAEEIEEKDPHFMSVMGTRKRAVSQLEITVDAASDSKEDQRNADFIQNWLDRDQLEDEIFDILDAIGKGYSVIEILWDTTKDQWQPLSLEWRDPRNFVFADDDKTLMIWDNDKHKVIPLNPYKFITHIHKAKSGSPIRGGVTRACAWMFLFKNFSFKDWVIFCETYGQPVRLGKYGAGATKEDRDILLKAVANIGSDAAAIIPESMQLEFVESKNKAGSAEVFEKLCRFCNEQMSKAVLGQTTTTDAISGGHAVSKEHNDVRGDIERADAKQVASTLNRDLVIPMIDLNFGVQENYPRIRIGRAEQVDTESLAKTANIGVSMGLEISKSKLRQQLGLPEPDPKDGDDDILTLPGQNQQVENETPTSNQASALNLPSSHTHCCSTKTRDNINILSDNSLSDYEELITPAIEQIEEVLNKASSFEDAFQKLSELAPDLNMEDLTEMMGNANFFARMAGNSEIKI